MIFVSLLDSTRQKVRSSDIFTTNIKFSWILDLWFKRILDIHTFWGMFYTFNHAVLHWKCKLAVFFLDDSSLLLLAAGQ